MDILSQFNTHYADAQLYFKPYSDVVYAPLQPFAAALGRPLDESMIMIVLIISLILSLMVSHIKSPFMRKLVNTVLGLALTLYTYGLGIIIFIPYNICAYICMAVAPRKHAHLFVIVVNGVWLTVNNIIRMM